MTTYKQGYNRVLFPIYAIVTICELIYMAAKFVIRALGKKQTFQHEDPK